MGEHCLGMTETSDRNRLEAPFSFLLSSVVEQPAVNRCVTGSIPVGGAIL